MAHCHQHSVTHDLLRESQLPCTVLLCSLCCIFDPRVFGNGSSDDSDHFLWNAVNGANADVSPYMCDLTSLKWKPTQSELLANTTQYHIKLDVYIYIFIICIQTVYMYRCGTCKIRGIRLYLSVRRVTRYVVIQINIFICLFICLYLFIHQYIYIYLSISLYLSIYLFIYFLILYIFVCVDVLISLRVSLFVFVFLKYYSLHSFVYLFVFSTWYDLILLR